MRNNKSSNSRSFTLASRSVLLTVLSVATALLLAAPIFVGSTASNPPANERSSAVSTGLQVVSRRAEPAKYGLFSPLPQAGPVSVATFAGDCTTAKSLYNVQDTDKTVCAQITDALPGWYIIWSNAHSVAVQTTTITTPNQTATFTLSLASSLGDWRVIVYDPFGGSVQAVTNFTVIDAANPVSDLFVNKGAISFESAAGSQALFIVSVTNNGPSNAGDVTLTDAVPANTTFVSFAQLDGPVFSCTNPSAGDTGTTTCTIANLQKGETATFLATYLVDSGATVGTVLTNTATVSSDTPDVFVPDVNNNTSSAETSISSTPCLLTCSNNLTQDADAGQAGASVNYSTPTTAGDCGQAGTGENGEPLPLVSCSNASGSFFPVGTTTVTCVAQSGDACSFQVTIDNPGNLSISLNGPSTVALECGTEFEDPGATAVDAGGENIEVIITGTLDIHTPASYTLTYTATEGSNSVSTTRTVNVSDTAGPVINVEGANPLTLSCGQTFTDPGVSANDACEGTKTVSSSGTVDSNTPGTYTITYTSFDSENHISTATRTVIVEAGGGTAPPTITLIGDPQMTVECGNFSDPGATATVPCGGSVPVTVTGNVDTRTPGTYTLTYSACVELSPGICDPQKISSVERTVTVEDVDTTAPTITMTGLEPTLWSANHDYYTFSVSDFVSSASDSCDTSVGVGSVVILQATSDEAEDADADGHTLNDIVIAPDCKSVQVRAERKGNDDGRVYTVTFRVRDSSGNTTTATAKIKVPQSDGQTAIEGAVQYTVNGGCP